MKNKRLLLFYLFLLVGIVFVIAINLDNKKSHDVSEVLVNISGYQMTLEEAIKGDYFQGVEIPTRSLTSESDLNKHYHLGEDIYLSRDSEDMNLDKALNSEGRLSGIIGPYSGEIIFGHSIEEIYIEINGTIKSLLDVINDYDICVPNCYERDCGDDGCGGSCGVCSVNCDRGDCSADCYNGVCIECMEFASEYGAGEISNECDVRVWWDGEELIRYRDDEPFLSVDDFGQCDYCIYYLGQANEDNYDDPVFGNYVYYFKDKIGSYFGEDSSKHCDDIAGDYSVCRTKFPCLPPNHHACYRGDVWRIDSCNNPEILLSECSGNCLNGVCCHENAYRACHDFEGNGNEDVWWFDSCDIPHKISANCFNGCSDSKCL